MVCELLATPLVCSSLLTLHAGLFRLEDRFPTSEAKLLPSSPAERAAVRLFISQVAVAPFYAVLLEQDRSKDAERAAAADAAMEVLEARFAAQSAVGPFFLGENLSMADVALLPFMYRFDTVLPAVRGYNILARAPRIAAALAAARLRPAWVATAPPPDFLRTAYSSYAAGKPGVPRRVKA